MVGPVTAGEACLAPTVEPLMVEWLMVERLIGRTVEMVDCSKWFDCSNG
jgi:hypothetical protein